ncbi:DUF1919 domain-containing protein [Pasteurella sp. PK-2025]|uniref:DUF1919 domain-containing protein n=1 Tax=unclassified Pasteurella TaxID=2621516 RepID=UPI003C72B8A6
MLLKRISNQINRCFRQCINAKNRKRIKNTSPTVISSNCTGAFMLHDLQLRFNSPFVNLYLTPKDFICYLSKMDFYRNQTLEFIQTEKRYPVGKLADLTIHFMHYHSEQDAAKKWQERTTRMNLANLFIIMTDRDGCTYEDLVEFDRLPFANKVVFTYKDYPELKSAVKISGFSELGMVGDLFENTGLFGKRYYDQFDYVEWFNNGFKN